MIPSLNSMEEGFVRFEPPRRSCLNGRIAEIFMCTGLCTTLPAAVGSGIMAVLSNRWEYQVVFGGVAAATGLWCCCLTAGVLKSECDRPYVQTGKDVREMRDQLKELQQIEGEKVEAQGLLSRMLDKVSGRAAQNREEAKRILSGMRATVFEFEKVRKELKEKGEHLVTDQYLQEVKSAVEDVLRGKEPTKELIGKLQDKMSILSGLFKREKRELKALGVSRAAEVELLRANRKLLKQFAEMSSKNREEQEAYFKALSSSLEKYHGMEAHQAKTTDNLRATAESVSASLTRQKELVDELTVMADLEEAKTAIAVSAERLRLVLKNSSATAKELSEAIQAHLKVLDEQLSE